MNCGKRLWMILAAHMRMRTATTSRSMLGHCVILLIQLGCVATILKVNC
jgi:hypothetical protein